MNLIESITINSLLFNLLTASQLQKNIRDLMICIQQTYLECIKPTQNKRAYYRVIVGYDLFGPKVVRSWGRIGTAERPRLHERVANLEDAHKIVADVLKRRFKHGYVVA